VIGTKATVGSGAYAGALQAARSDIRVTSMACPLLVPLVEEGLFDDPVTDAVLERYLAEIRAGDADALVLGCTHYPLLSRAIARVAGPGIALVDSAANCARVVARHLDESDLCAPAGKTGSLDISFTDAPDDFLSVVRGALGLEAGKVRVRPVPPLGQ
jgi:glutamate racemase